jgi:sigma-B regulation protein RsbU (phosphoserine phosphatase)
MNRHFDTGASDILVVDDTTPNLRLLGETLSARGHRVRTVTSGARAIDSALAKPPDLILLDIRMPEMDGFEVCRRLKANERTQAVPIIFISALNEIEDKMLAFQSGGVDYITKPFQVEEVLARTNTHLALRRLQRELESRNMRLEREMDLAGKVQASFLPHSLVHVEGWDLSACLHPARATSGDFYDVLPLPGGQIGLLIADVVDKGVPAALLMAMSWGLLCSHTSEGDSAPTEVFDQVNHTLVQHLGGMQFLTVFLGILDPASGRLTYANAGHPPPLLLAADGQEPIRLGRTGPPLGVLERSTWEERDVTVAAGEAVLFYTDGITEATRQASFYGLERLAQTARSLWPSDGAESLLSGVFNDVQAFSAEEPQSDDIALLTVTRQIASA